MRYEGIDAHSFNTTSFLFYNHDDAPFVFIFLFISIIFLFSQIGDNLLTDKEIFLNMVVKYELGTNCQSYSLRWWIYLLLDFVESKIFIYSRLDESPPIFHCLVKISSQVTIQYQNIFRLSKLKLVVFSIIDE